MEKDLVVAAVQWAVYVDIVTQYCDLLEGIPCLGIGYVQLIEYFLAMDKILLQNLVSC